MCSRFQFFNDQNHTTSHIVSTCLIDGRRFIKQIWKGHKINMNIVVRKLSEEFRNTILANYETIYDIGKKYLTMYGI
jgi:hypothetical protein